MFHVAVAKSGTATEFCSLVRCHVQKRRVAVILSVLVNRTPHSPLRRYYHETDDHCEECDTVKILMPVLVFVFGLAYVTYKLYDWAKYALVFRPVIINPLSRPPKSHTTNLTAS